MIIEIIEGEIRSQFNLTTDIMKYRLENFCKKCPATMKNGKLTGTCQIKNGGCGCSTRRLTAQNTKTCPLGFWANDWHNKTKFEQYLKSNEL